MCLRYNWEWALGCNFHPKMKIAVSEHTRGEGRGAGRWGDRSAGCSARNKTQAKEKCLQGPTISHWWNQCKFQSNRMEENPVTCGTPPRHHIPTRLSEMFLEDGVDQGHFVVVVKLFTPHFMANLQLSSPRTITVIHPMSISLCKQAAPCQKLWKNREDRELFSLGLLDP